MIVCNRVGGWEFFENYSTESDCMGDSVDYDCRDKSDVNETADRWIVWNHSTRGDFLNDSVRSILLYWRWSIEFMDL